jgi:hypothetical protein
MNKSIQFICCFLFIVLNSLVSKGQILVEGFEGTFPPVSWTQEFVTNNNSWTAITGNTNGAITNAHSGTLNASIVNFSTSLDITKLVSPSMNLSGTPSAQLEFWYSQEEWGLIKMN